MGEKTLKQNEEGTNLHARGTKSSATSTLTSIGWIHTTRTSLLIYPMAAERWQPPTCQWLEETLLCTGT